MSKAVAKVWTFKSSSGSGTYETLQYVDGSTSCDCPGWTRRVDASGNRSCKHTRSVHQGTADGLAVAAHDYASQSVPKAPIVAPVKKSAKKSAKKASLNQTSPIRKIRWQDDA